MFSFMKGSKPGPIIISCLVIVGFVSVLVLLILKPITFDEKIADILKILVGTLAAKFGDVVQYHIGSSAGSRGKDDVLNTIATSVTADANGADPLKPLN